MSEAAKDRSVSAMDRRFSITFSVLAAGIFLLFAVGAQPERGLVAACSFGVIATVTYLNWSIHTTGYCKAVITLATILHVSAVYYISPPHFVSPVFTVTPIAIADTLLLIYILDRLRGRNRSRGGSDPTEPLLAARASSWTRSRNG